MKNHVEWQDEPEIFEAVAAALTHDLVVLHGDEDEEAEVFVYDEHGPYGERGRILIVVSGRRFALDLHELT